MTTSPGVTGNVAAAVPPVPPVAPSLAALPPLAAAMSSAIEQMLPSLGTAYVWGWPVRRT
jgi:hypothetical protein